VTGGIQTVSGETRDASPHWTLETLRVHLQSQIAALDRLTEARSLAQDERVALALTSAQTAVTKAETATEKRFESVNEFRRTLSDQTQEFVTRREFEQIRDTNAERIREMQTRLDKTEGRSGGLQSGYGYLVAGIGAVVVIVNLAIYLLSR
jgi:hypothetical protein